jgi:para-aminobenzoate synthetase component 1
MEWRLSDGGDPAALLRAFLEGSAVGGQTASSRTGEGVALLVGAAGCAAVAGLPLPPVSPCEAVPELVAIAVARDVEADQALSARPVVGEWRTTWSDAEHAAAVEEVRQAIARGDVYQANVVGHRSAPHDSDPADVARAVASIDASYAGVVTGEGWAVGCASPEQLVRVTGRRITTQPIKGTRRVAPGSREALLTSEKDRAEHVMIVDLERNDLARVAMTGSVDVEELYGIGRWSDLWQAESTISAELRPDVDAVDVLRAVLPGGSVTGAPKHAAVRILAGLEPVGRGPAMGAFGFLWPGGMDLGLTIRTVAVDAERVHLWAGGGITWGSDPDDEVAEAHAKAAPVLRALSGQST